MYKRQLLYLESTRFFSHPIHDSTVADYLHQLGFKSKLDTLVSRQLTENNKTQRKDSANALLTFQRRDDYLKTIVTGTKNGVCMLMLG